MPKSISLVGQAISLAKLFSRLAVHQQKSDQSLVEGTVGKERQHKTAINRFGHIPDKPSSTPDS